MPADGGVVLAGNHVSYLDPVVIPAGLWRRVSFMAKSELFAKPVLGWLMSMLYAFPVRRELADREAIATAGKRLEDGWAVGIFPEGTRVFGGEVAGQEGAAFIALRAGAPLVPVGIDGTGRVRPRGVRTFRLPRITVVFGEPIDPASFPGGRKERVAAITAELMARIRQCVDMAREA